MDENGGHRSIVAQPVQRLDLLTPIANRAGNPKPRDARAEAAVPHRSGDNHNTDKRHHRQHAPKIKAALEAPPVDQEIRF